MDRTVSYADFAALIDEWVARLGEHGIGQGAVCAVIGDYSPQTCALFFALMRTRSVAVPFTRVIEQERNGLMQIAGVRWVIDVDERDAFSIVELEQPSEPNAIVEKLSARGRPGLIVFTSGSTGKPKGILHDCERVMQKFATERPGWRTVLFLMMDHFGGFNTYLSAFAYGGVAVCVPDRSAEAVCRAIQQSRADLLPTTPTFLNLLIASGSYKDFDLSSVKLITYGTEVMPEATLQRIRSVFPRARLKQTYGLSELGVLRSKSKDDDSVWVRIGGDGFEVKIIDQILWVRSESSMIGYLNAPDPFDGEGWMCTGDHVEVRGDFVRILGRKSEFINVGGQKVFPSEVESILLEADNVHEATAYAAPHPIFGQVVHCRVSLAEPEDPAELTKRLRRFCVERMAKFKIPMRFNIVEQSEQRSDRFKKVRRLDP
jgi:acyl-CoA synthetase (AMP-forming)/AMP-acid ligase II